MENLFGRILGLLVLGLSILPGAARADSPGPYYATPSWDQTLPAATRFIVLSNFASAAVLDRNTGLVWEKSPDSTIQTWTSARGMCIRRNVGGQMGFRLPSIVELSSLVDPLVGASANFPTLPTGHPFQNVASFSGNVRDLFYWSATTIAADPDNTLDPNNVWYVEFDIGQVRTISKNFPMRAWCVRGGGPLTVY